MLVFTITDNFFKTEPLFVMGCSHTDFGQYLQKRFKVDVGLDVGQAGQMFTFEQRPWRVVWVKHRPSDYDRLGILLHEIFHLVTRICQDKGVPIKAQIDEGIGDEAGAYLYDFFAREVLRRCRTKLPCPRN